MKNDLLAKAMTSIDDKLIDEASACNIEKRHTVNFKRSFIRFGSLAACAVLAVGIFIAARANGSQVIFNGEVLTEKPVAIEAQEPRIAIVVAQAKSCLPLEMEFRKETKLYVKGGTFDAYPENGDACSGVVQYTAKGKITMYLYPMAEGTSCTVETNDGYSILIELDPATQSWFISKENNK